MSCANVEDPAHVARKESLIFLGSYQFTGDTSYLLEAYDQFVGGFPPGVIMFQVCVARDNGITVFDACPTREVFTEFSQSPDFAGAIAAAGLPVPIVEPLGDVHNTIVETSDQ